MADVTPDAFEEEVRRVARALWPEAEHGGPEIVNGREVDGIFKTEEVSHMVEATMDRRVEKAHNVGPKLRDHLKRARNQGYFAKSWFVTYHPPTADQRKVLHDQYDRSIQVISYEQFRSKIINAREYLELRDRVGWGSAANPTTNSTTDLVKYVPLGIYVSPGVGRTKINDSGRGVQREEPKDVSVGDLAMSMGAGGRIALLGDYGAGKSMTLREVHAYLKRCYLEGATHIFPITLSLRRHYGQDDPAEALTRHANFLGFQNPAKLVSAWRNGFAHILLDGFDELAAPGWSGSPEAIRENRRAATELINEFSGGSQEGTGIIVAGRRFYFDTLRELGENLFNGASHVIATLSDFSADQAKTFLGQFNERGAVPEWLPQRPLLLGHLAAEGILRGFEDSAGLAPAPGWEWLLDRISDRESFIKQGVDGPAVRQVIEQLASFARQTPLGVGPVSMRDIVDAFTIVRRKPPSDRELTLLQRLPGLGGEEEDSENGTRRFVDQDLASAAQAQHVSRFVIDPYGDYPGFQPTHWHSAMEPLGVEVVTEQIANLQVQPGILRTALARAITTDCYELAADLVGVAIASGFDIANAGASKHTVSGAVIPSLDLGEGGPDLSGVEFTDCMFEELVLSGDPDSSLLPLFNQCTFFTVVGRLGETDMPLGRFTDCAFENFPDAADRNAAIMESVILPAGTRVVMTLLRKLYLQRGRGRKDSALTRGMDGNDAALVTSAMQLLQQEGLAVPTRQGKNKIWLPDRSAGPRVRQFLAAPRVGDDPLVPGSRSLGGSRN